jgi:hypothetical protein
MEAFHALGQTLPQWPSPTRVFTAAICAIDTAVAHAGRAWFRSRSRPFLPPMSPQWLLDHEIASSKHQDAR